MAEMNQEFEMNFKEYGTILWQRKWLIISLFVVAFVSTYFYVQTVKPIYETSAVILVTENDEMQSLFSSEILPYSQDMVATYSKMLKTRSLLDDVIQRLHLLDANGDIITSDVLKSMINVNSVSGTDLIEISLEHEEPEKAMNIVNTLVNVFQTRNTMMNRSTISGTREFIEGQLQDVKIQLEKSEKELLSFKQEYSMVLPSEEAKQTLERLIQVETFKEMILVDQKTIEASIQEIQRQLGTQKEYVTSNTVVSNNPLIKQYKGKLIELEGQLIELKVKYTTNHPEVVGLEEEIKHLTDALNNEIHQEVTSETQSANPIYQNLIEQLVSLETSWIANLAKIESYDQLIASYEYKIQEIPEKELKLTRLERITKVTAEIYTMLMKRMEEIKISESMQTSDVYIVEPAFLPKYPIKPNKKSLIVIASILGVFMGIALSVLLEYMNNTVKTTEQVERLLNIPVLGSIPDMRRIKK